MKIWRTKYLRTTDITGALIMKAKLLNRSLVLCILLCFVLAIGAGGCKKKPVQYTLTVAIAGQGQVTPDVGTHKNDAGTVVTLTATPQRALMAERAGQCTIGTVRLLCYRSDYS